MLGFVFIQDFQSINANFLDKNLEIFKVIQNKKNAYYCYRKAFFVPGICNLAKVRIWWLEFLFQEITYIEIKHLVHAYHLISSHNNDIFKNTFI